MVLVLRQVLLLCSIFLPLMMSFGFPFLQNADAESGNIFSDIWSILSRDQCLTLSKWLWNSEVLLVLRCAICYHLYNLKT